MNKTKSCYFYTLKHVIFAMKTSTTFYILFIVIV